jgi:hypothetical protein
MIGDTYKKVSSVLNSSAPTKPKVQSLTLPQVGSKQDTSTADLLRAMELPLKVTGLSAMALIGDAIKAVPLFPGMQDAFKSVTGPVAAAFGVSDNLARKVNTTLEQRNRESKKSQSLIPGQMPSSGAASDRPWWDIFGLFSNRKKKPTGGGGGKLQRYGTGGPGGMVKNALSLGANYVRNAFSGAKPNGLSTRGAQAGFTGMAKEGFDAIMGGDKFRLGKWKPQILGRGAYSAPTLRGAQRYAGSQGSLGGRQTPGGVVKTIVPGGARRINFIEPQAAVKPETFDKGKRLADKLLGGAYGNSSLANKLRSQLTGGSAARGVIGAGKLGGKLLGILGPILDIAFPDPVGEYDQISGPNAWYNDPKISPEKRKVIMAAMQPPSSAGRLSGSLDSGSKQVQFNRMNSRQTPPPPMVLNNVASKSTTAPSRISHIDTVGDPGVDSYISAYSPYN